MLVRSHRQGSAIKQALAALNVGSVELSTVSVFASADAEALERVLCAIWTPARLPLLRAALSTELIGSDAQTIAALPDDARALMHAVERFADYRTVWLDHGVGAMIRQLIRQEDIAARMLARPDGERRMTNLLHLAELLHQASEMHTLPDSLLRWLQTRRVERNNEEAAQLRLESDRNLVQILTMHKSKGLEFPVVFCPFLWDGHRQRASGIEGREYHADDGSTVINFCPESRTDSDIDDAIRTESDAEDLRLIYVALTRAIYRSYVVTGCYLSRNITNQSQTSLLNWLAAGRELRHDEWRKGARKSCLATDIEKAWASLAHSGQGNMALLPLPTDRIAPLPAETVSPESLTCQPTPPRLPYGWRISSFSGLTRGATHENAASDYDAILPDARDAVNETTGESPIETTASVSANDIMHFPKGTNAGLCIHKAFELCDFADSSTWQNAIEKAIAAYPQEHEQQDTDGNTNALAAMLQQMMQDVLHTTLPDDIVLKNIPSGKRLNELGFYLPASRFSTDSLHATLKTHGYPVPSLSFTDMACYLKGFIDLVFEHNGRYYILDWKSNHLGHDVRHYDANNVQSAMQENAYHLQYLLYSVALNRYLVQRIPDYRYDTHFGGVHYLFVRGVRPDWKNPDGSPSGVFFDRPSPETMAALDALFTSFHAKVA